MKELIRRLFHRPVLAAEILTATLFTAVLTLAMPLYVIQILNRYISYGFHGTLITLTIGMFIAVMLQFCFRIIRTKMSAVINEEPNNRLSRDILSIISRAKAEPLERIPKPKIQEALNHVHTIQQNFNAHTLNTVLDAPFSLIFIWVIYLLNPILAYIVILGILLALIFGWLTIFKSQKKSDLLSRLMSEHRSLNFSAVNAMETVRAFGAASSLFKKWDIQLERMNKLSSRLTDYKELSQTTTLTGSSLTSVFLYAAGAVLVVKGQLSVGALIGANILCGRAYQNITKLVQTSFSMAKTKQAFNELSLFKQLPFEPAKGAALESYNGKIEFQDVSFSYPNTNNPLFESLTLSLEPGKVLAVFGENGTGKTTLAKLLTLLLEPGRGNLLADGVNLLQMAPVWWRRQIIYMPQEPSFINGSLRENLLFLNPDLDDAALNDILRKTNLKPFLDKTPNGLDTLVTNNEKNFPPGIRKRIALARGLAGNGNLVVMDEPTDAMDQKGLQAVYSTMNTLARSGKTIIVFSNDPKILKGASLLLNLNKKPVPEIINNSVMPSNELIPS